MDTRKVRPMSNWATLVPLALALAVGSILPVAPAQAEDTPPAGVEQILPRGGIPAVFEPSFVPAAKAKISKKAWVFGVLVDGTARAYSLNLLNRHEIVNDKVGENEFAAVW